ncbi:26S proteasome non-ATPase regulatory subunit 10-like [Condylostylus longicornis]|uniref:26S proteasome non-ATPase regulatory subunit 10-like n=1 Tax=Condylostylus longicornis TaxID=2530218 RepID=UPI00244DBAAB|nr:26S proteasome non-ATPase regulatory subunit 10-like [Condylostylus longicornis]
MNQLPSLIDNDDFQELKRLLLSGLSFENLFESIDEAGNTIIHLCSATCRLRCLEVILSTLSEQDCLRKLVNHSNNYGRSPLHLAAFYGWETIVDKLLEIDGIRLDGQTKASCTPLYFACCRGHLSIVERLLSGGANPNSRTNTSSTPLIAATVNGAIRLVQTLLLSGADANLQNSDGMTAMHLAAEANNKEIIEILISSGGNSTIEDSRGRTFNDILLVVQKKESIRTFEGMMPIKHRHFRPNGIKPSHGPIRAGGGRTSSEAASENCLNTSSSTTNHTTSPSRQRTESRYETSPSSPNK